MEEKRVFVPVVIWCITYNQEPYIRQCLEGFVIQNTNFPFVALVHDDASTDGTAAIIKEYAEKYPDIIIPIIEIENQWSKHDGSLVRISNDAINQYEPKYVAWCEGDDYWIDPQKLQKQFDFMESHPNYSCCHTAFNCVDTKSNSIYRDDYEKKIKESGNGERFWFIILVENNILTCTFMIRREIYITRPYWYHDYGMFLNAARQGFVGYIPDRTSCYRLTPGSIMNDFKLHMDLAHANKKITVNEIVNILKNAPATIFEVKNFPKKHQAIARLLIFCVNSDDKELKRRVMGIFFHHPLYIMLSIYYLIINKKPSAFYVAQ